MRIKQLCWKEGFAFRKTEVWRVGVGNAAERFVSNFSSSFSSCSSSSSSSSSSAARKDDERRTSTSKPLVFHLQLTPRENAGFLNLSRLSHGKGSP
jgi:hypothetical protein